MVDEGRGYLVSEIETVRSNVMRAGALNAKAINDNAQARLENVLSLVVVSPELEDSVFQMVNSVNAFAAPPRQGRERGY